MTHHHLHKFQQWEFKHTSVPPVAQGVRDETKTGTCRSPRVSTLRHERHWTKSAAFEDALFLLFQGCPALHLSFLKSKHFLVHYKRNVCP